MTSASTPQITVVGLGPGDASLLTLGACAALLAADRVWVRTLRHPTLDSLDLGDKVSSFDGLYNTLGTSEEVYRSIAESLVQETLNEFECAYPNECPEFVYAVPGSPSTGERSVAMLRRAAMRAGVQVKVLPGVSAVEAVLTELGVDPLVTGLHIADAEEMSHLLEERPSVVSQFFNPTVPIMICHVWQHSLASAVKLFLLANYEPDWQVQLVRAGLDEQLAPRRAVTLALEDLDRSARVDHLTTLYVPPRPSDSSGAGFYELTHIIARLRGPSGCPWDREQTHASLKRYLLEEAYEALHALDIDDPAALEEELGDVLLQVSLHSEIGYSESEFDIGDVIRGLTSKLVRRHPHVFGETSVDNAAQVSANWQEIKRSESAARAGVGSDPHGSSALDGVPVALPALERAQSVSNRAAKTGFDWRDAAEVWAKVREEIAEVEEAVTPHPRPLSHKGRGEDAVKEEFGDLLFVLVNWARFNGIEAEEALRLATLKFERRFRELERRVAERGVRIHDLGMDELDRIWEDVKQELSGINDKP